MFSRLHGHTLYDLNKASEKNAGQSPDAPYTLDDVKLLEIVICANDGVVSNIDALNVAAVGILALPAAFSLFAIDKIRELPPPLGVVSLLLLLLSGAAGAFSYELGYVAVLSLTRRETLKGNSETIQDAIVPRRFLELYAVTGFAAVKTQADQAVEITARNARIRESKRLSVRISLYLFVIAAAIVAVGRLEYLPPIDLGGKPCTAIGAVAGADKGMLRQ